MQRYSFRGPDRDLDHSLHYAKYRDRALVQLGPRASDSIIPGLSSKVQATATQKDNYLYDQLLTGDGTMLASSQDNYMTKEVGYSMHLILLLPLKPWNCLRQIHIAFWIRGSWIS